MSQYKMLFNLTWLSKVFDFYEYSYFLWLTLSANCFNSFVSIQIIQDKDP